MNECSNKEEQENQFSLSDELNLKLIELSKNGKYNELKIFLEKYNPNKAEIDLAIRKCLKLFKRSDKNYYKSLKELFKHADLNYCNPTFDNSNLIMQICAKSNSYLFDLIFEQNYSDNEESKINTFHTKNNKNNIKENKSYVDINLYHLDQYNNNLFHYLFKEMDHDKDIVEDIIKIMNYKGFNNNKIYSLDKKKYLFTQPNNDGITPIIIILNKGNPDILISIFKFIDYQKYIIPSSNNNLIHCSIEGKDIKCVKKILSYCNSIEELKFKNKEGYTPLSYAKKLGFYMAKKLIEEVEKNIDNKEYKDILLSTNDVDIYDILGKYMVIRNNCYITSNIESIQTIIKRDYNTVIYNLKKYELDNSINEQYYYNIPSKWNILLSKTQMNQLLNYINNEKTKSILYNYLEQFSKFFKQDLKIEQDDKFFIPDVFVYNKLIFHYKLGNFSSIFDCISFYFNSIYGKKESEYNYYEYTNYVTISFILIEYFIFDNDKIQSLNLLNHLENYLNNNINYQSKYEVNEYILKYLNHNEIFNPFIKTWDDAYGLLNLMRVLYILKFKIPFIAYKSKEALRKDKTRNEIREYLSAFEERNKNCEREELVSSNRLKGFATINKCYYYYLTNILNKSLKNLHLIKESLYNLAEYKIFYFNTLGIINLKRKKYKLSEYLFKIGILLFSEATFHNSGEDKIFYNIEYITKMKYNLGLALCFNNKYYEAYILFQKIKNNIIIKNNPFFWFRFGLTALNIYLISLKKLYKEKQKEKNQKYEEKNIIINEQTSDNKNSFEDSYSYNYNYNNDEDISEGENDELFIEFEKFMKKEKNDKNIEKFKNINIKRIFIQKFNLNKKDLISTDEYLITSIQCFKKSILHYKKQPYTILRNKKMINDIKYIMKFYNIENNNFSNSTDSFYNFNDFNISQISLFSLSYINLLFCLSLDEKYNEVLLLIKVFPTNLLKNNNDIKNKLDYFKLNAMMNLKRHKEIENIINKYKGKDNISDNNSINDEISCLNFNGYYQETKLNHESYLLLAEIYLDIRLKKYDKAEKNLSKLIKAVKQDKDNNIYIYYNQLMIYILLLQNKDNQALNLIKYKWNQKQHKEKNKFIKYKNGDKNG